MLWFGLFSVRKVFLEKGKEKKAGKLTKTELHVILQIEQTRGEEARTFKRKTGLLSNKGRRPLHEHKERLL
jgi:hypothetical protein